MRLDADGQPLDVVDAHRCDSVAHAPRLATWRLAWVSGPVEYCDDCARQMQNVAGALGLYVHAEAIVPPLPDSNVRAIDFNFGG